MWGQTTHGLWDVLVLEALEVEMVVRAVLHHATLRLHPALGHKVELRVYVYGLNLGVVVVVS